MQVLVFDDYGHLKLMFPLEYQDRPDSLSAEDEIESLVKLIRQAAAVGEVNG